MKVGRQKRWKKNLAFYNSNFGITAPYHILVDGTFCRAALQAKVNIADQLPKFFDSEVKLSTTPCCKQECRMLGPLLYGPLKVLKQYQVVACGHKHPVTAARCLMSVVRKSQKMGYFIATQDEKLSGKVRKEGKIPLLFISHNSINLEDPSETTKHIARQNLQEKLSPAETEIKALQELKKSIFGEQENEIKKKKKKKGGPNPLSCKKKKLTEEKQGEISKRKRKRRKKKLHIAPHVKEHLKAQLAASSHGNNPS